MHNVHPIIRMDIYLVKVSDMGGARRILVTLGWVGWGGMYCDAMCVLL